MGRRGWPDEFNEDSICRDSRQISRNLRVVSIGRAGLHSSLEKGLLLGGDQELYLQTSYSWFAVSVPATTGSLERNWPLLWAGSESYASDCR